MCVCVFVCLCGYVLRPSISDYIYNYIYCFSVLLPINALCQVGPRITKTCDEGTLQIWLIENEIYTTRQISPRQRFYCIYL